MSGSRVRPGAAALVLLLAAVACSGSGSDIGPRFARLSGDGRKATVLDGDGRAVAGAALAFADTGGGAVTGRNGRADVFGGVDGRQRVVVDGSAGAAVAGDQLGGYVVAVTLGGGDFPAPFHLPVLEAASAQAVAAGTQAAAVTVANAAGDRVEIAAGSSLGLPGAAATGELRAASLLPPCLPGDLPAVPGQAVLWSRGCFLAPPTLTCAPAAAIEFADELGLGGGGTASLYHLERSTGEWTLLGTASSSGGRLRFPGAVATGGLYAVATVVPATAVTGRLVDALNQPVAEAYVAVDGVRTRSDASGRFTAAGVPQQLADGSLRAAGVRFTAGGSWLPQHRSLQAGLVPGTPIDLDGALFDTVPAGNVRVQQILRGRATPFAQVRFGSEVGPMAFTAFSDADGQAVVEDVPHRWFGFQAGSPVDGTRDRVVWGQSLGFLNAGRRWLDVFQYFDRTFWYLGSRRARVFVVEQQGGGPVLGAALVAGSTANTGLVGVGRENSVFFTGRDVAGRATATATTARGGFTVTSGVSIERPNGEHLELPLPLQLREPFGSFDRHGLVAGRLLGADPARQHRLRSTRRFDLQEWWDDVVEGRPLPSSLPLDLDPAVTHDAFAVGVAAPAGHLAAAELTAAAGVATLQRLGLATSVAAPQAQRTARDLALDLPATTDFTVPQGLVGLDANLAVADLRVALALDLGAEGLVDCVRDLGGNHRASGSDLVLTLPALGGALAGRQWRAAVRGSAADGATTIVQQSLLALAGGASEAAAPLLPPPSIQSPAPGATVDAAELRIAYTLPAGALFATIDLRSETGSDRLLWRAYVPPDLGEFTFRRLPAEAAAPLVAGRSYTVTVTAYRADRGPLLGNPEAYGWLTTFLRTIGPVEYGVTALASRTLSVTTQ